MLLAKASTLFVAAFAHVVSAQTIVDIASGDEQFSTLVAAVEAAGLVDALNDPSSALTVFAPTDEAFMGVNVTKLLEDEWSAHLDALLKYHVVGGEVYSSDLTEVGQTVTTLEGTDVELTSLDPVQINQAEVTAADIKAEGGVIHVIDDVLLPPSATDSIVDIAIDLNETFSTLVELVSMAGLVDTLAGPGPYTVFAPTNEAFSKIPEETLQEILADTDLLKSILLYHVVPGIALSSGLEEGTVDTAEGSSVTVSLGPVMINDANVVTPDVLANNGVIHVIDTVLLPSLPEKEEEPPTLLASQGNQATSPTIVDIALGDSQFSTLVAALMAADLVSALSGEGPFTVFAPTDDAFESVDVPKFLQPQWGGHLDAILKYHVVSGEILSTDLSVGLAAPTLEGSDIVVTSYPDPVTINDSNVIAADVVASNGVVHVVDQVLLPPFMTTDIVDIAISLDDTFSTLVDLVSLAGLVETLQGNGPFTVFAPTNDAFAKLPAATVEALKADTAALTDVLTYHVLPGILLSSDLAVGASATTVQGSKVTVTSMDPVMINDSNVVLADVLAANGVIHVIDTVLIPSTDPAPAPSPSGGFVKLVSDDYEGPGSVCIAIKDNVMTNGQRLVLEDCAKASGWKLQNNGLIRSELNDDYCMQAGYGPEMLGTILRINKCRPRKQLQRFEYRNGGGLRPKLDTHMCAVWRGVNANIGEDPIILKMCDDVKHRLDWSQD